MGGAAEFGEFTFKSLDKRAACKSVFVNYFADGSVQLLAHRLVMGAEIQKRNLHK